MSERIFSDAAAETCPDLCSRVPFFKYVSSIKHFRMVVWFPSIAGWEDEKLRSAVHDRLLDDARTLVKKVNFYKQNQLEQKAGSGYIAVEYQDDIYDFSIVMYKDRLELIKRGVSMGRFHDWFHAVMPGIDQTVDSILATMKDALKRVFPVVNVSFRFEFIAFNFDDKNTGTTFINTEVMEGLTDLAPGPEGTLEKIKRYEQLGRIDYKANCWDGVGENRRKLSYSVEAPSNNDYAGLWFNFAYGCGTFTDPRSGVREAVEPELLLQEHERVYSFLSEIALAGFMRSLVKNRSFATTATYIP